MGAAGGQRRRLSVNGAAKLLRLPFGAPCVRRGDVARDEARFLDAVMEYRRALRWMPWREDLKVQLGNCLKEFGDYEGAVRAYGSVAGEHQAEAHRQMQDAIGRGGPRMLPYIVSESPGGHGDATIAVPPVSERSLPNRLRVGDGDRAFWLGMLSMRDRSGAPLPIPFHPGIKLVQVGTLSIDHGGVQVPLLAGVVAIRGRIAALVPLRSVDVRLGVGTSAQRIATAPLHRVPTGNALLKDHAFNVWIDAASLPRGRHWLSVSSAVGVPAAGLFVIVGDAGETALPASDSFVPSPTAQDGRVDEAVLAAPAQVRPASRGLLPAPARSILAIRADQLGDLATSLPALRRLRVLFPEAKLTMLVQPNVAAAVRNSGLADEVLSVDLVYSHETERRHLPDAERGRLAELLGARAFDLAIDLSPGDESRPLLLLSGATYLVGFNPDRHPFLDFGIAIRSRDKSNGLNMTSHGSSVATLVEALALALRDDPEPVPALPQTAELLAPLGLCPGRYIAIHTGARHAINCWPLARYVELTARLLAATDDDIVFFGGSDDDAAGEGALRSPRVRRFDLAPPELFDALLSHARLMIGNDSGPKHLAAVRGVPTVSVHVNRLNWNEWGQTGRGAIVSKRVPCAGCALNNIDLCAREAACLTAISVDEVMGAIAPFLAPEITAAGA